jgi:hypothetical protein
VLKLRFLASVVLAVLCLSAGAYGGRLSFEEYRAVQDSLHRLPMSMQSRWFAERGIELPGWNSPAPAYPDSGGLRMVGKWGRGPAMKVTGRDSLLFLSLGSEVAILSVSDPHNPRVISEVQALGLVSDAIVRDSFLYVGCRTGTVGIDVWNIENLATPVFRGRASTRLADFCIQDTFAYVTSRMNSPSQDSFKVFSMSDPANPRLLGWCRDSGEIARVSGTKVVVSDWNDIHIMDVSDPSHPRRAGSIGVGGLGVDVRGNLVCATKWWNGLSDYLWIDLFDISNPSSPRFLGEADSVGGYDIRLSDSLAFVSGFYYGFGTAVLNIADSTRPRVLSQIMSAGWREGIWPDLETDHAYVANDFGGLTVMDVSDLSTPRIDTTVMQTGLSENLVVRDTLMFVTGSQGGMQIANVANPAHPRSVSACRAPGARDTKSAVAGDSFAFIGCASRYRFYSVNIADIWNPVLAESCEIFNPPEDMVLRDSLVYCAEANRFQVVNVARPREPVLVGSCNITGTGVDVLLKDTLAYVSSLPTQIVNVADPTSPVIIGTISTYGHGIAIHESFAFMPALYDSMVIYNVADPTRPLRIARHTFSGGHVWNSGVALIGKLLYVGGDIMHVLDVSDPLDPVEVASWLPPYDITRLSYSEPWLYAACYDAGVCVLETLQLGIQEPSPRAVRRMKPMPTVVRRAAWKSVTSGAVVFDAMGRRVTQARPGVYLIVEEPPASSRKPRAIRKVVLTE